MQHQSHGLEKGLTAATNGAFFTERMVSPEEIERHIAAGKRLQAEAIAGFFKLCFRRLGGLFHLRTQGEGQLSRA